MPTTYVTKSDFATCRDCRTKFFYRKNSAVYPSTQSDNEYLQFLADGGFMVEFIAKARFPTATDLSGERNPGKAAARTAATLTQDSAVIFEAAATSGSYHIRTDILQRAGSVLNLIEVKSSSVSLGEHPGVSPFRGANGRILGKWKPYLMDVAFQVHVLRAAYPHYSIQPHLCLVNKDHQATEAETLDRFHLHHDLANPRARPIVTYEGDVRSLAKSGLLVTYNVADEVELLMPDVLTQAEALAALLRPDGSIGRHQEDIAECYKVCRTCEFRPKAALLKDGQRSGFRECWGRMADVQPHILDLYRVGQIAPRGEEGPVPPLLRASQASILDLVADDLGKPGPWQERRQIQWEILQQGTQEHLPHSLKRTLKGHESDPGWPLNFIDFEACNVVLPHHAQLKPYERVAFQWSCHTVDAKLTLHHRDWINTQREFPNFAFARSLRDCIGDAGTVYVWSGFEAATLANVMSQIGAWIATAPEAALRVSGFSSLEQLESLATWVDQLLGPEDQNGKRHSPRIRDLHALALEHYFHRDMGGRTSIKVTLPAIWKNFATVRNDPWFAEYLKIGPDGKALDPYKTLEPLPFDGDEAGEEELDEAVRDGTGAIRVYQDLIFNAACSVRIKQNREFLLRQYCKLDTTAMVMIWKHWTGRTS